MADAPAPDAIVAQLVELSHELGQEARDFALLGEGNTSARVDETTFLVKASGSSLGTLTPKGVTHCALQPLVELLDQDHLKDAAVETALMDSRVSADSAKPSVEAMFHAWLLTLPGVDFVGHVHPVHVNALLASPHAAAFAHRRLFPDQIVCCGAKSVLVPYCDPGLTLAKAIREAVEEHLATEGHTPRLILLENHGLIALGSSPAAVLATTLMAEKSARIMIGAIAAAGPRYLSDQDVARIAGRADEHYRQKALGL
ncbi:class II aldolase/adducin family protein [Actomonas aquatica]|uniref:Class II aldolase/adducin family protein n=1 Tax=Actomonas aquatica TaxID=2866162 RepID=A0ABZ1CEJ1_9BACT|nr:class II aldolase/adducin family protein [Opitutus sp. WL0086]WRQ90085.1 class II aldolase/adducin family protein [Opitutus sp. WL0086]